MIKDKYVSVNQLTRLNNAALFHLQCYKKYKHTSEVRNSVLEQRVVMPKQKHRRQSELVIALSLNVPSDALHC